VDPRAIERLLSRAHRADKPADARIATLLERYLSAVEYAGAALVCGADTIVVHSVESLDPSRVDAWLRRWASDARVFRPELRRVPRSALALASAHAELPAMREVVYQVVPEADQQKIRHFEMLLTGLLLGQDIASRILPALGPGVIAYLDSPVESAIAKIDGAMPAGGRVSLFPLVVVIDLSSESERATKGAERQGPTALVVSDAIDNALRTVLTVAALDDKCGQGRARIATREIAGASVNTLDIPIPFAYALDRSAGRLVLGTSAVAVGRYLESGSDPEAGARFRDLQAAAFPGFSTFLCVDLDAMTRLATRHRERLAHTLAARQNRPPDEVGGDLEHVLALARLFRAAFVASRIEPDATAVYRTFGVVLNDSQAPSSAQP
jgi:hypothetical protein